MAIDRVGVISLQCEPARPSLDAENKMDLLTSVMKELCHPNMPNMRDLIITHVDT